jgi:hypothetical protein
MDLENFYVTPPLVMITSLRWWNTLNHKIPKVCVQRERKRQIGTFFVKKIAKKIKNKKNALLEGTGVGCPVTLLAGFPSKVSTCI